MVCSKNIQNNRLSKLEGLECLVQLEELYVSFNGIKVIEGIETLVSPSRTPYFIPSFFIPHSPILHSPFSILHSPILHTVIPPFPGQPEDTGSGQQQDQESSECLSSTATGGFLGT